MSENKINFRRDRTGPAVGLVVWVLLGVAAITVAALAFKEVAIVPIAALVVVCCLVGGITCISLLGDTEPKLIIDAQGMTDNRAAGGGRVSSLGTRSRAWIMRSGL